MESHKMVVIGDVSDKGVPAAIFMALTRSLLRAVAGRAISPRREQTIPLPPGSTILLYTDGATDLTGPEGVLFGLERLQALAQASLAATGPGRTAQAFCDGIWQGLTRYQGTSSQDDDVALVAIRATERT